MPVRSPTFSIFRRQCLQSPTRPGFQMKSTSPLRYFNSTAPHYKAKGVARTVDSAWQAASPYGNKNPRALAKLQTKVLKAGQVLLFKAPFHRPYVLTAYGLSAFCFAYSIYNSNAVLVNPLVPLPMWQKSLFGGICVMMSVGGTLFISRTGSLVKNIRAVNSDGRMRVLFSVRSMVPFKKPYQVEVAPGDLSFKRRLSVSPETMKRYEDSTKLGRELEPEPTFVRVLKSMPRRIFQSMRQIFTNEDFIIVQLAGHRTHFRLDSNGYISDDLLHFGRMVNVKLPFRD
ncbi:structural maintenance of chromosomes protein 1 [Penicillium digitatum]|nr:structural maintenance of chromosomes protein 1 [Penicillium digitatum]